MDLMVENNGMVELDSEQEEFKPWGMKLNSFLLLYQLLFEVRLYKLNYSFAN
jgi:hypothetical protein